MKTEDNEEVIQFNFHCGKKKVVVNKNGCHFCGCEKVIQHKKYNKRTYACGWSADSGVTSTPCEWAATDS